MKLAFLTLIFPILASASGFNAGVEEDENGYDDGMVIVDPELELWNLVTKSAPGVIEEEVIPRSPAQGSTSWAIWSFLGSYFTTPISSLTKSDSAPEINATQKQLSETDANYIASILNCDIGRLRDFDIENLQRVVSFKGLKKFAILAQLAVLGDRDLFEMFFDCNLAAILAEITCSRDFHNVVFSCIKIKSMYSFFNMIHNLSNNYALNAPQAIIAASIVGCEEIIRFVLEQEESTDVVWEWKRFDGGDGYMLKFGANPLSAALFLGSLKALSGGHIECFKILIDRGLDICYNNFSYLKEISAFCSVEIFDYIFSKVDYRVPLQDMKEIFLISISSNNAALVEHLLLLNIKFNIQVNEHLIAALNSKNENIVQMILANVKHENIDKNTLSLAASLENENNFISVLKVAKQEHVLASLCSCIIDPNYHHYVARIISEIYLSVDMISLALNYAVKSDCVDFVQSLLAHNNCDKSSVKSGFKEALYSDNVALLDQFFAFKKFELSFFIRKNEIEVALKTMIEKKAWNTLKLFTEKYYTTSGFPKHIFVAMILETDQVEIVKFLVENGAPFAQSYLKYITNAEIRDLVSKNIRK